MVDYRLQKFFGAGPNNFYRRISYLLSRGGVCVCVHVCVCVWGGGGGGGGGGHFKRQIEQAKWLLL